MRKFLAGAHKHAKARVCDAVGNGEAAASGAAPDLRAGAQLVAAFGRCVEHGKARLDRERPGWDKPGKAPPKPAGGWHVKPPNGFPGRPPPGYPSASGAAKQPRHANARGELRRRR